MDGIGGEISSKIRAAIKVKLMEMGAYVDEELPDYVMVMVANKRSKAQMAEDLQLFLGKSTDQFTNWLQQVLNKLQEVATGNNKSLTDAKKVQTRTSSSDDAAHKAKSASKVKCDQMTKSKLDHAPDRASGHRSEKKRGAGAVDGCGAAKRDRRSGGGAKTSAEKASELVSTKTKIVLMNSDDDDDEEDFINIKADAEAEALLKAELPTSARRQKLAVAAAAARCSASGATAERARVEPRQCDVTAALAHSTSGARKIRPTVRRVVAPPVSVITVATDRPASRKDAGGLAERAGALVAGDLGPGRAGGEVAVQRNLAGGGAVAVTNRPFVRPGGGTSIKDRLGVRSATTGAPAMSSRLASRLGTRNLAGSVPSTVGKVTDRLGTRPAAMGSCGFLLGMRVTDQSGARRGGEAMRQGGAARKRAVEGSSVSGVPEVPPKKPAADVSGSRLAQRLRELAEGPSAATRVAHVLPNNIRQGGTMHSECRPSVNSRVVPAVAPKMALECRDGDDEVAPDVAVPSVVRVTPRPRLPASMQANKNLLLKAVAEAQRSVAAAAVTASGTAGAAPSAGAALRRGARAGRQLWDRLGPGSRREEEWEDDGGGCGSEEEEEDDDDDDDDGDTTPENPEGLFTRGFLNGENFAVTVSNESGAAEDSDEADVEMEEQSDDDRQRVHPADPSYGIARLVMTASGEPRGPTEAFGAADVHQQITIQLSPEGSHDDDSSSGREDEEMSDIPLRSADAKDATVLPEARSYDERPMFDDEEEEPATTVAAVRPTVVTTIPHMDTEPVSRPNPQFVVTLDGLDASMFPNAGMDDDEGPGDPGCEIDRDTSKGESGGGGTGPSAAASSIGKATVVQRVEPRLRLGPLPTHRQQQHEGGDLSPDLTSSSGITSAKSMERCKYWPACRMADKCAFHHPTQTCRAFPACKFGEKCLYIHPNCKFDATCTRRDCPYTHSSLRLSVAAPSLPTRGAAQPGGSQTVCRFFPGCTNPTCRFLHPKACRYGRYCVKPGCTFQHDGVPTTDKLKWVCPFRA